MGQVRQGGGPTVRLCEISGGGDRSAADAHDTCGAGIYVHQGGSGLFEACQVCRRAARRTAHLAALQLTGLTDRLNWRRPN